MRKAQGLPLSFIVIAAIAALVLILVVAFTIGGLGGFFKQITTAGGAEELGTVQSACNTACNKLVQISTIEQFQSSDYCKKSFTVDLSKDGKITATPKGQLISGLAVATAQPAVGVGVSKGITPIPGPSPMPCTSTSPCETSLRCWSKDIGISCRVTTTTGTELMQDAGVNGGTNGACGTNLKT